MIRFKLGGYAGHYELEEGIVIETAGDLAGDLAQTLQAEISALLETSPHAHLGPYAMAKMVLERAGAKVDLSDLPKYDPGKVY